jgi:hypothetical protein
MVHAGAAGVGPPRCACPCTRALYRSGSDGAAGHRASSSSSQCRRQSSGQGCPKHNTVCCVVVVVTLPATAPCRAVEPPRWQHGQPRRALGYWGTDGNNSNGHAPGPLSSAGPLGAPHGRAGRGCRCAKSAGRDGRVGARAAACGILADTAVVVVVATACRTAATNDSYRRRRYRCRCCWWYDESGAKCARSGRCRPRDRDQPGSC